VNPQLIHYADNVADTTYAGSDTSQINKIITIPKLNIDTPVFIGSDPRTSLTIGWWSDPRSHWMEHGEILVYCHRRYFAPSDQRSCWHLDQLEIGDEIYFGTGETRQLYKVIGKNIFAATDSTPQQISETEDYLKIVTTEPLLQNDKRLVILAKLQE
jgi:LPXTG-site transpeptidase (sortase) family protein